MRKPPIFRCFWHHLKNEGKAEPGDNTRTNYAEANKAFWRATVIPTIVRIQKAFENWLAPAFGEMRIDYDVDRIEALASERKDEWARIGGADFLTQDEKRELLGFWPAQKKIEYTSSFAKTQNVGNDATRRSRKF